MSQAMISCGQRRIVMKYLVTGGAGFVGSHLCEALLKEGGGVRVLDNLSTGDKANIAAISSDIEFLQGDVQDEQAMSAACAGIDVVFHQAAYPSVPYSLKQSVKAHGDNLTATAVALAAAQEAGVKRFVFASSAAVYGDNDSALQREDGPLNPLSNYAVHKLASEWYLKVAFERFGMETVALRYFNIFGPRQDPESDYASVIPIFIRKMLSGEQPTIFGDGSATRDFVFIDNVIRANVLAAQAPAEKVAGKVLNVASGTKMSVLELVSMLNKVMGTSIDPILGPERDGDIEHSSADISRAQELLGYSADVSATEGLQKTVDFFKGAV